MTLGAMLLPWLLSCAAFCGPVPSHGVPVAGAGLAGEFLLQISYEQRRHEHFMTSRSRVVTFRRSGDTLLMLEARDSVSRPRRLATIPILDESDGVWVLDLNTAFDRVYLEEDRTGEDYYGRVDRNDYSHFPLFQREIRKVRRHGTTLVLEQHALDPLDQPVVVHYYLSPYEPNPGFRPVEVENLEHFGFFQTYPQRSGDRTVLYATKFDVSEPIVFALSSDIPARYRQAVRDGIQYWNKALGEPLLRAVDAPEGIYAPDAQYNVLQWKPEGAPASTSHIQTDPRTGEILHAHIFLVPQDGHFERPADRVDHLRYVVAHEVGHALGLRHNFAPGPVSTVMNYFSLEEAARIGADFVANPKAVLEYDSIIVRKIYLGERTDVAALPPFCTDDHRECSPFAPGQRATGAAGGELP